MKLIDEKCQFERRSLRNRLAMKQKAKKTNNRVIHNQNMRLNRRKGRQVLNYLKFQQYSQLQQYYQTSRMTETESHSHQITSQPSCNAISSSHQLTKFKPWVFKPKKVIYSLDGCPPTKKEYSTAHWNLDQNEKYIQFLIKFKEVIEGERKRRRKWHLNRIMSKFIGTRSHQQCRSHHQKMIKNYKSVEGIIQHLQANRQTDKNRSETSSTHQQPTDLITQPLPIYSEESVFNILQNPMEYDESFIRIPIFYRDQSNDIF